MTMTGKAQSVGLLILRIGIGVLFILHGVQKFIGGEETLTKVGQAMKMLGVTGDFKLWGTMAALTETVGGVALIVGILFRPLCVLLFFVMGMATASNLQGVSSFGDFMKACAHPISQGFIFLALVLIGPGRYNLGKYVNPFGGGK